MKKFYSTKLSICIAAALATQFAQASLVRSDVDYQTYRDFAENKGKFKVGAVNIPIFDINGNSLGTALPKNVPIPDFSHVDTEMYIATLINNQYTTSVKHNLEGHYSLLYFGGNRLGSGIRKFDYSAVDRNDHEHLDYNVPRLNKMVTEVAPVELATNLTAEDLYNGRYLAFARVGAGTQGVQDGSNVTIVGKAYNFPTAGTTYKFVNSNGSIVSTLVGKVNNANDSFGPLINYLTPGDSGSSLFGYDKYLKKWVLVGNVITYTGYERQRNNFIINQPNYIAKSIQDDKAAIVNIKSAKPIKWVNTENGKSELQSELNSVGIDVANGTNLAHGKDVFIKGLNTTLQLEENINQGAGGLYFLTSGTVKGVNDSITHQASGVVVDEHQRVNWQVKNPTTDRISKLGKGDLIVNGNGTNYGSISVGEGNVYLEQKNGFAFGRVTLASGRGKVILNADNQVRNTTAYQFDSRGGILDLNGHNLTFADIYHVDNGARIVNGNRRQASTVTLSPSGSKTFLGDFGTTPNAYTTADSEFDMSGVDTFEINSLVNNDGTLNLNLDRGSYHLMGNTNLKGDVNVSGGSKLTFSGSPTLYADKYDTSTYTIHKIVKEDDYENRIANAKTFNVSGNSELVFGRNLIAMNGHLNASETSKVTLGTTEKYDTNVENSIPVLSAQGKVTLSGNSNLTVGKAHLTTQFQNSDSSSITMKPNAVITLNGNSQVGNLAMEQGAIINLNEDNNFDRFNQLTVGHLTGQGIFRFSTDVSKLVANKLIVNGSVSGSHQVTLRDSGREITKNSNNLEIIKTHNAGDAGKFSLSSGHVDLGAFRYTLQNGVLTVNRGGSTVQESPVDPNFKAPDFNSLDYRFSDRTTQDKIKDVLKAQNYKTLSYDELVAELSKVGLITEKPETEGVDSLLGKTLDLSMLTDKQREILKGNEQDLSKVDPALLNDNTAEPVELAETVLYDTENAILDGLTVKDGKIVNDTNSTDDVSEQPSKSNVIQPTQPQINVDVPVIPQKVSISKYTNAGLNAANAQFATMVANSGLIQQKLHANQGDDVWVKYDNQELKSDNPYFRQDEFTQNTVQVGGIKSLNENTRIGLVYGETRSRSDMADNVGYKNTYRHANLLLKHQMGNAFITAQVGGGKTKQTFNIDGEKPTLSQNVFESAMSVGYGVDMNNVRLTPYAGVTYYQIGKGNVSLNGADVQFGKRQELLANAGVDMHFNINVGENVKLVPYIGINYQTGSKERKLSVNDYSFNHKFESGFKTQAGMTFTAQNISFNVQGAITQSKSFKRNSQLSAGVEYHF